jgi:Sigma-70, region 4
MKARCCVGDVSAPNHVGAARHVFDSTLMNAVAALVRGGVSPQQDGVGVAPL